MACGIAANSSIKEVPTGGLGCEEKVKVELPLGRWPTNLILQHKPECRKVGPNKGEIGDQINRGEGYTRQNESDRQVSDSLDPDSMETTDLWECVDTCPVRGLGEQSGFSSSRKGFMGERHGNIYGGGKGPTGPAGIRGHDDAGTAARFFKQVQGKPK